MRAWSSVSAVAVHHGWAKEPSDSTGENISYTILHTILFQSTDDFSLSVLQAVGRLDRKRENEDINIHLLKPARFAVDPLYSIPPTMSANIVQDARMGPGEECLTYAYRTSHPVLRWLPTKLTLWIGANLCEELNIPNKQGPLWTALELNAIIAGYLVCGHMAISTRLDASSGKTNSSAVGRRQDAILSIFRATVYRTRIHRYILYVQT